VSVYSRLLRLTKRTAATRVALLLFIVTYVREIRVIELEGPKTRNSTRHAIRMLHPPTCSRKRETFRRTAFNIATEIITYASYVFYVRIFRRTEESERRRSVIKECPFRDNLRYPTMVRRSKASFPVKSKSESPGLGESTRRAIADSGYAISGTLGPLHARESAGPRHLALKRARARRSALRSQRADDAILWIRLSSLDSSDPIPLFGSTRGVFGIPMAVPPGESYDCSRITRITRRRRDAASYVSINGRNSFSGTTFLASSPR